MRGFLPWPPDDGATHTVTGRVLHRPGVVAPALENARDLWVCLPARYDEPNAAWPVVYMQDGQNLFDAATAFGGQEWGIDEALATSPADLGAIIVGIANTGAQRIGEYSPFRDEKLGGGRGEAYLDFVTDIVKPMIDGAFRTRPERVATFLAGSSMGGLIALHGFLTRPHVFGGVAALSPSLWFARRAIFQVVGSAAFGDGRVYVDTGTREGPGQLLDVARLRDRLLAKGYRKGENLRVEVETGGRHSETAWAGRFPTALRFLLGSTDADAGEAVTPAPARPTRASPRTKPRRR